MQRLARCISARGCLVSDEPLISVAEAARRSGLNRSTLSRQVNAGRVRSHNGRVLMSEVVADRRNIGSRFSSKRIEPVVLSPDVLRARLKLIDEEIFEHDDAIQVLLNRIGDKNDELFAVMFLLVNAVALRFPPEDESDLSYDAWMEILASTAIAVTNKVLTLVLRQLAVQRNVVTTSHPIEGEM
jgi:hypothetical protein